jgi:hypothetical protein
MFCVLALLACSVRVEREMEIRQIRRALSYKKSKKELSSYCRNSLGISIKKLGKMSKYLT